MGDVQAPPIRQKQAQSRKIHLTTTMSADITKSIAETYAAEVRQLNEAAFDNMSNRADEASKRAAGQHKSPAREYDAHGKAHHAHDNAHWAHRNRAADLINNAASKRLADPQFHKLVAHHMAKAAYHWEKADHHDKTQQKMFNRGEAW